MIPRPVEHIYALEIQSAPKADTKTIILTLGQNCNDTNVQESTFS